MKSTYNSKQFAITAFTLILLAQIACICYWGNQKVGFHLDEIFTYVATNGSSDWISSDVWMTKQHILDTLTVKPDERFSFLHVIENHSKDVHPPFYYLVFHTFCSLVPSVFSKWNGIAVNILFFILTQITIFLLSLKLTKNRLFALLPCLLYGFSIGAHTTAIMIRMYMTLTFFCTLAFYMHSVLLERLGAKENISICRLITICLVYIFGILTHYYFIIFGFFTSLFFLSYLLIKKSYTLTTRYIFIVGASIPLSILCYPSMLHHIFRGGRGTQAFKNFSSRFDLSAFSKCYEKIDRDLLISIFIVLIIITMIYTIVREYKYIHSKEPKGIGRIKSFLSDNLSKIITNENPKIITLVLAWLVAIFYFCVVAKIVPYKINRYFVCIYPLLSIFLIFTSENIFKKIWSSKSYLITFALAIITISTLHIWRDAMWTFKEQKELTMYIEKNRPSSMIVLFNIDSTWPIWPLAPYWIKLDKVYVTKSKNIEKLDLPNYQGLLCLDTGTIDKNDLGKIPPALFQKKILSSGRFHFYELNAK